MSKLFFLNQTPSCICSMCLHCIGKVSNCSIKSCSRSWSAHEGHPLCIFKSLIREKLSKFSQLSFRQKLFFLNKTPSCICSMCLHCIGKASNCSIKSCGRSWSAHEGTIYAYTKALLGKNCRSSHSCHFVKNIFSELNSFMHMFNVSTLYKKSIKLFHQQLWKELIGPCMAYDSISIKHYIKSHLELQREITLIELAPSPYFFV